MNRDVFDLTENRIFSRPKRRNNLKTSYHHDSLLHIFTRFSFSVLEFLGKAQKVIDFDTRDGICPKCGNKIKGLECHCDEVCDRCGAKLKFDENILCKRCGNILERDHNKRLFLREIRQR